MSATPTPTAAARLRLIRQERLALHAVELLSGKEAALERECARLSGHASRTEQRWRERSEDAATWLLRSRMLGCTNELDRVIGTGSATADIDVTWQNSMGVTYPGDARCAYGAPPALFSTAALASTVDAHREALAAAADHAVMSAAVARLHTELVATRRRRRAIEDRLLPRLSSERHALEIHLDEQDRDQALRVRLASKQRMEVPS